MRKITPLLIALLLSAPGIAQDSFFVHTATAPTISSDLTWIDHPDLNDNPDADIVISHSWNPPGSAGVYNTNNSGLFYGVGQGQWGIYNENGSAMIEGSSYNVYIGNGTDVYVHIADLANQGTDDSYSVLNHPDINNNPDAIITLTTYYNPSSLRNDKSYGLWYDDGDNRWIIYAEDLDAIPLDSAFFVSIEGTTTTSAKHVATAGNISGNYTVISHPLLDGDPEARFVFTHNWGASGDATNVIVDEVMGAWYTGSNWAIYTEDLSDFPVNAQFNLMIYDAVLSVDDTVVEGLTYAPNPTQDIVTFSASTPIEQVEIFNVLGQKVMTLEGTNNSLQADISGLNVGQYFAKVQSGVSIQTVQLIRN